MGELRLGGVAAVACAVLLGAGGCGKTTCGTADFECIMSNSTFEMNGASVRPVRLPIGKVPAPAPAMSAGAAPSKSALSISIIPMSAPNFGDPIQMIEAGKVSRPGGGASGIPAATITMAPADVMLTNLNPVQTLSIGYDDPYGMQPSFILLPNIGTPVCWAFPPLRDLKIQGVAKLTINATNVQMTPVGPSAPDPTVIMPTPVEPTPIGPSDIQPSVITATPVVSWFQPPLEPVSTSNNGNGGGGDPFGLSTYTACSGGTSIACNGNSPPQCGSQESCCNSNGYCKICVPNCTNAVNVWGPCYASACTNEVNAAVNFCCPPSNK